MTECSLTLEPCGEVLLLHPQRAVVWPRLRTVIVADTHFGKGGVFRRHGLAVPAGADERDCERLSSLVAEVDAERLIILGDFLHAPLMPQDSAARVLADWRAACGQLDIQIIAGNHDRHVHHGWLPSLQWHELELYEPPFRFVHDADRLPPSSHQGAPASFVMAGHIHPVARLRGPRKGVLRTPVFWQRRDALILPSFGSFTGGFVVAPAASERLYAVGPERVVPLSGGAPA